MDYINYVKQSPMQGMTGMWGGVGSNLIGAAADPDPGETEYFGGRGLLTVGGQNEVNYWSIENTNNASNFGEMSNSEITNNGSAANTENRCVWAGGDSSADTEMMYLTSNSSSSASDFGDMTIERHAPVSSSNGVRQGIACGSGPGGTNLSSIEYITPASTGNGTNFGNATVARHGRDSVNGGAMMLMANGQDPHTDVIDYVHLSTTGNASNFADTTSARTFGSGCNSDPGSGQLRGVFCAGFSTMSQQADYITIATQANAQDWGELLQGYFYRCASGTNGPRGYVAGGTGGGNEITYMTIESTNTCVAGGDIMNSGDAVASQGPAS
tara:strand:+ start:54 stop:1034 length:981 start_codon:yes stop_codon:yes gene_type:complete